MIKYDIQQSYQEHFDDALTEVLSRLDARLHPLRLLFFGRPLSTEQYAVERFRIARAVQQIYGQEAPVITYVAQRPLAATLAMEAQLIDSMDGVAFHRDDADRLYITCERQGEKALYTEGISAVNLGMSIEDQSREVFAAISKILDKEGFAPSDIVRQWNYIEQITSFGDHGQNYQQFNDARSEFYDPVDWITGYPAATGIGMDVGGVVVEVDVLKVSPPAIIAALDNSLQVAAHEYSSQVLLGTTQLTTPKFERAKAIVDSRNDAMIYVSGTAAIRGEASLIDVGIGEQTMITIENIEYLISGENLEKHRIFDSSTPRLQLMRVYLKFPKDYSVARQIIDKRYPEVPTLYVLTDVCREELLIEIEGIAY